MPNLEVKPVSVDGTVRGTHGRADHCQFRLRVRGSLFRRTSSYSYVYPFMGSERQVLTSCLSCALIKENSKKVMLAVQKVVCPFCGSDHVVFNGKDRHGNQRCMCKNPNCDHMTFALNYKNNGSKLGIKEEIITLTMNGSGVRDISRSLEVSKDKVISTLDL